MDPVAEFSLRVEQNGQGPLVQVSGALDVATAPAVRDCLRMLDGQPVTVDLTNVTFMDSSGLAALCHGLDDKESRGGTLVLRGVQPAQMKIFELTGLGESFNFDGQ